MKKIASKIMIFSLALAAAVDLTWTLAPSLFVSPLDGGPLDYKPRLEATATSPDRTLTVKIYRQRGPSYSLILGADVFVQIDDNQGRMLYRDEFGRDGAWDELDSRYEISFERDKIYATRLWCRSCGLGPIHKIIGMSELRMREG